MDASSPGRQSAGECGARNGACSKSEHIFKVVVVKRQAL